MDHVWITEYATTCGIRPKYILIHDQIHVSVRGVSSPNWGGIMTMPCVVGTCTRRRLYYSESLVRAALSSGGFHVVGEELTRRVLLIPVYYVPFRRYKDSQALSSVLLASPG